MDALTAEQQAHVDGLIGQARVKARDKAIADSAAARAKATDDASKAALAADAKWEALNKVNEARVKELEPFEAKAKEYDALMATMLADKVKALGDAAKKAVAGLPESLSVVEKLKWLSANEELFQTGSNGVGTPKRKITKAGDGTEVVGPKRRSVRL